MSNPVGRPSKYPWNDMNVGDTFIIPYNLNNAIIYVCRVNKKMNPKKFKAIEDGVEVIVKRIA